MSDAQLGALFAVLAAGFCLLALWSMRKAHDDVMQAADLNERVHRLELAALPEEDE